MRTRLPLILLFAALSLSTHAQQPQPQPQSQSRPTSDPYRGDLSIFEEPGRDKRLQIDRVMDLLHITSGKTVADIGAGSGWFTVRAARRVGPSGQVFAEDINPEATRAIETRARKENLPNIHSILGTVDDPALPAASTDIVMMLKVYHEIAHPIPFMQHLRQSLRPGARIAIIDRNGSGSGTDHGLPQGTLEKEMREAGYRRLAQYDFTKGDGQDYFLIFEPLPN